MKIKQHKSILSNNRKPIDKQSSEAYRYIIISFRICICKLQFIKSINVAHCFTNFSGMSTFVFSYFLKVSIFLKIF